MDFNSLFEECLPLNRKERFFTGTVFPMIVCRDNFKYINNFFSLIKGFGNPEIIHNNNITNIQFFTEYSLKESRLKAERWCKHDIESKDTPDILIYINDPIKYLVVIEAKMYDNPLPDNLFKQMKNQKPIINCITSELEIEKNKVFHYALIPKPYYEINKTKLISIDILTWEDIYETYNKMFPDDYFVNLLGFSLAQYKVKVSQGIHTFGANSHGTLSGQDLYDNFINGKKDIKRVGRSKGESGFLKDIRSGEWNKHKYEYGRDNQILKSNWISIERFVELVNENFNPA